MSEAAIAASQRTMTRAIEQGRLTLQRKCACGDHTVASDECEPCRKERLKGQRWDKNHTGPELPMADFAAAASTTSTRFGADFTRVQLRTSQPFIQRMPRGEPASISAEPTADQGVAVEPAAISPPEPVEATPISEPATLETTPAEPATEPTTSEETAVPGLLVADDTTDLGEGQMRKSEFLGELRTAVCTAADAELAAAGRDTEGCPYLDYWFDYYGQRDAGYIERALSRYAPQARTATSARDYIPIVAERVRQGVARWVRTGEVSGVPEGVPTIVPGEPPAESIPAVQAKARSGGAKLDDDPAAIRDQLGDGRPLDSGVRSRMESAFGTSFGHVRLHNDINAANLSSSQNARAFTVGEHVAFGAGEYQPGTLLGDAIIAHELAHVVQQSGATDESVANMEVGDTSYTALERDADQAAIGVTSSLWKTVATGLSNVVQKGILRLRSGLSLQRCATARSATTAPPNSPPTSLPSTTGTPCPTNVRVGAVAKRNHSDLSASDKERYRTYLGAMSRMDVGPGPDHSGHCMKEALTTITNTCPAAVYTRGDRTIEPCTGNKCLDINRYGTMWGLSDGPTSFFDMHRTRNTSSLLEGTGVDSCRVVCEQTYSCDRTQPTTGTFRITRNYQAGTHTTSDGNRIHITTGTVEKIQV